MRRDGGWRRLDPRMLVVSPVAGLVRLLPAFAIVLLTGQRDDLTRLWITLGGAGVVVAVGVLRWATTRYRITDERVELHHGLVRRRRRAVPRDRIRTVDLTARLEHRVFGLSVVHVGSAAGTGHEHARLSLDAVSRAEADRLRRELLDQPAPGVAAASAGHELARLDWGWLRFAPLTFSALAGVGAVLAAAANLLGDVGVDAGTVGVHAARRLAAAGLWAGVGLVALGLLTAAVVGALALFAERWFGYRLTREPDASLRVTRGLLTRRSLSVAHPRLRGVETVEPLLLRLGRGAQTRALAAGFDHGAHGGVLQPPVPLAEALRVAAAATGVPPSETVAAPLRRHPRAALSRRLVRAVVPAVLLALAGLALGIPAAGPLGVTLVVLAVLLGIDRYRSLGHTLTAGFLVTRQGTLLRRTVALQRSGVIGVTLRQSVFQRRAGLATLHATTATGRGGYAVLDLPAADAAALADALVPLRSPFAEVSAGASRTSRG